MTIADRALLIYTSGTTGLPKAANVSHRRLMQWSLWFAGLMNTGPDDRMYDCLPLYHSVGGVVATGAVLVRGGSVLIREKFSAQHFWDDVVDGDCTLFQYIGELCRYLRQRAEQPARARASPAAVLRQRAARRRLGEIPGNDSPFRASWSSMRRPKAMSRSTTSKARSAPSAAFRPFSRHRFPLALVKFDADRRRAGARRRRLLHPLRHRRDRRSARPHPRQRLCTRAATSRATPSAEESEQKILRDVFERGDAWFRTGDLMRMDASGFFYFVDRIGDTFRWKGENVATYGSRRGDHGISRHHSRRTSTASRVPGTEGAAGMAAIVATARLDVAELRKHLARVLPPYARPLFLRITDRIEATATFKHTKNDLKREGYDPAATSDPIYLRRSGARGLRTARPRALSANSGLYGAPLRGAGSRTSHTTIGRPARYPRVSRRDGCRSFARCAWRNDTRPRREVRQSPATDRRGQSPQRPSVGAGPPDSRSI